MKVEDLLDKMESKIDGKEVIGSPYQVGEVTFVPIINLTVGGGVTGEHGGGGVSISPVAIIMIKSNGEITFFSLTDYSKEGIEEKLPKAIDRIKEVNL
jgi:uncharacterized spore protein YtfJ